MWHGYILVEDLGMTVNQRETLIDFFKTLGENNSTQPAFRNHRRIRLDSKAVIFEARFNKDNLTIQKFKDKLAEIFNIEASEILHSASNGFVTFAKNGDKLLTTLFGGNNSTWEESRLSCSAYLKTNQLLWEEDIS